MAITLIRANQIKLGNGLKMGDNGALEIDLQWLRTHLNHIHMPATIHLPPAGSTTTFSSGQPVMGFIPNVDELPAADQPASDPKPEYRVINIGSDGASANAGDTENFNNADGHELGGINAPSTS